MEFEEEHDDPDEEMEIPDDQQPQPHPPYHHPSTNSEPPSVQKPSSSSTGVRYRECQKNHAVGIGGSAIDGCGEFMASGEEGTLDALRCAACNCHRNFHRKETADSSVGAIIFQPPHHHYHHYGPPPHHQFSPYYQSGPAPSGYLQLTAGQSTQQHLALPASGGQTSSREDADDYLLNNPGSGGGRSGSSKKRFRTKFTPEQRERMLGFAERLGWRIQKHDDVAVEQFCTEIGIRRHVLKVWMHNNKNSLGRQGNYGAIPPDSIFIRCYSLLYDKKDPETGGCSVLSLKCTSLWWFDKTSHITSNTVVASPDNNVTIAKKCSVFPVEVVVRGFVTGSTDTSLWTVYSKGVRNYCGNALPNGLLKNQRLPANILTPTTKTAEHDVPITPQQIVERGLMTQDEYDEVSTKALSLFEYGQAVASDHGLILVDTKYEFGRAHDGSLLLIDEVHTPDSSRYWIAHSYDQRFQNGFQPENVDKEFLRLWFKDHCNPYKDEVLPDAPQELITELAWLYIFLYETITNREFEIPSTQEPIHDRISANVASCLASLPRP